MKWNEPLRNCWIWDLCSHKPQNLSADSIEPNMKAGRHCFNCIPLANEDSTAMQCLLGTYLEVISSKTYSRLHECNRKHGRRLTFRGLKSAGLPFVLPLSKSSTTRWKLLQLVMVEVSSETNFRPLMDAQLVGRWQIADIWAGCSVEVLSTKIMEKAAPYAPNSQRWRFSSGPWCGRCEHENLILVSWCLVPRTVPEYRSLG